MSQNYQPRCKIAYTRGYLTHHDVPASTVGITFRLADSVPARLLRAYASFQKQATEEDLVAARRRVRFHLEKYLGKGKGSMVLRDPQVARIVEAVLREGEPTNYVLIAWVIMPNHVHVMIRRTMRSSLPQIVRGWKGASARRINALLGRSGALWFRDYFDRDVDDDDQRAAAIRYIELNPVKAGLCRKPDEWEFSSARTAGFSRLDASRSGANRRGPNRAG